MSFEWSFQIWTSFQCMSQTKQIRRLLAQSHVKAGWKVGVTSLPWTPQLHTRPHTHKYKNNEVKKMQRVFVIAWGTEARKCHLHIRSWLALPWPSPWMRALPAIPAQPSRPFISHPLEVSHDPPNPLSLYNSPFLSLHFHLIPLLIFDAVPAPESGWE